MSDEHRFWSSTHFPCACRREHRRAAAPAELVAAVVDDPDARVTGRRVTGGC